MERCDIKTESGAVCGRPASNWCYLTSGAKEHNHNVCDDHWDARQKSCRQAGAAAQAPPGRSAPGQGGGGRGDSSPPVRKI